MALSVDPTSVRRYIERSLSDLPALPAIVTKVLELSENPETSASELEEIILADQAITAKFLRVVNSAYYGLATQISSISHAVVILGFQQVRNIVLSMAAMSLLKSRNKGTVNILHSFWRHSFGTGAAAIQLAKIKKIPAQQRDLVHVGGILHDIGQLFLFGNFTDLYRLTLQLAATQSISLHEAEKKVLGITNAEVGGQLAHAWNFPKNLIEIIEFHHGPFHEMPDHTIAIVHAADYLTKCSGHVLPSGLDPIDKHVEQWLELQPEEIPSLMEYISKKIKDAEEFFEIF